MGRVDDHGGVLVGSIRVGVCMGRVLDGIVLKRGLGGWVRGWLGRVVLVGRAICGIHDVVGCRMVGNGVGPREIVLCYWR